MRSKYYLILLLNLGFFTSWSQKHFYEAHVGALTSQLSGDGYRGYKKFGFEAGVGILFPLKKEGHFWSLQLNYIEKGARDRKNEERGDFNDYRLNMNYIEIPLTYWLPLWGVYFEGGMSLSYRTKFEQTNNGIPASAPVNLRSVELGLLAGVNLEINDRMIFGLKVLNSLTPVQKTSAPIFYWFQQGGMHSVLSARIQYFFNKPSFTWVIKKTQIENEN